MRRHVPSGTIWMRPGERPRNPKGTALQITLERLEPTSKLAHWQAAAALNSARYWDWGAERSGHRVHRVPGFWAADSQSPNPFPNSATLTEPLTDLTASAVAAELQRFYDGGEGGPWLLWSAWETPDLANHGLQFAGQPPLMVRWPWQATAPVQPFELTIREVTDAAGLTDWLRVIVDGYPAPELAHADAPAFLQPGILGGSYRLWVGEVAGEPVSCAAAFTDGVVTGVYAVATLPAFRGRGYGAALTDVAASADPALPAVLQASDLGQPVYRRLAFRAVGRFTLWAGSRRSGR